MRKSLEEKLQQLGFDPVSEEQRRVNLQNNLDAICDPAIDLCVDEDPTTCSRCGRDGAKYGCCTFMKLVEEDCEDTMPPSLELSYEEVLNKYPEQVREAFINGSWDTSLQNGPQSPGKASTKLPDEHDLNLMCGNDLSNPIHKDPGHIISIKPVKVSK